MPNHRCHVYLAGDSTMQTYSLQDGRQAGWGQFIAEYFHPSVTFYNYAIGGRSTKTFIEEGRLANILSEIEAGDYLFVQMGHNDSTKERPARYTEPYQDYKQYLRQYVEGVRSKGAVPILITPVARLHYVRGEFLADFGDYCNAMKEIAAEMQVDVMDLMQASIRYFTTIGYQAVMPFFMVSQNGDDHTHFTDVGASQIARIVSEEVKKLSIPLSQYVKISEKGVT
ncbi:rhamnogalacturonan acetylesterase [Gracilibacillus alcaliphilus]|uniref:rhamnogalacturonan acetylesterase n=1 Tax=Gracilibacillus alcaliphilus TaxID=1401441 RepID=UPI00195CF77C|nr:rhamnogalacturonan acetylesterase [Gracilibacillus alcaliphilus]MBM7677437.1 lysophospholipase L1-like esterase [Gracilibacillus alcaliphilus]